MLDWIVTLPWWADAYISIGALWAIFCFVQHMIQDYGKDLTKTLRLLHAMVGFAINFCGWPISLGIFIYRLKKGRVKVVWRQGGNSSG